MTPLPLRPCPHPPRSIRRRELARSACLVVALWLTGCASLELAPELRADLPEIATGTRAQPGWQGLRHAVAAAHPLAAEAGERMLRAGGAAIDAAIAAQMVLALVEPQSSGIGGGGFLMHWDGRQVQAYDGRETAPAAADEQLLQDAAGRPLPYADAVIGGRSVGVPGLVRMLELAHRQHGRLPWAALFEPAVTLAEQGFEISPRLHRQLQADTFLRQDPVARGFYYRPDGDALPAGTRLRNPELAAVLRRLAAEGSTALHQGEVAEAIVRAVQGHPHRPGRLSRADLAGYRAVERQPLCHDWRQWRLCGMPPPSSGALAIGQILGILEHRPALAPLRNGLPTPELLHDYSEAARLAFADRARYVADPDFVPPPGGDWHSLLAPRYLAARARLIGARAMGRAPAGTPARPEEVVEPASPVAGLEQPATSHLSVIDAEGRAVAMTSSIEAQFGARLMVNTGAGRAGGFLLNNQLTDFSFSDTEAGRPIANRVQPGKRPRSSMSPTLVFERRDGSLRLSTGSPGGPHIVNFTAKALLGTLAWGLSPQAALDLPNFGSTGGPTLLERGRFPAATAQALRERGHAVEEADLPSGVQLLERRDGWLLGGADPRREGAVRGE